MKLLTKDRSGNLLERIATVGPHPDAVRNSDAVVKDRERHFRPGMDGRSWGSFSLGRPPADPEPEGRSPAPRRRRNVLKLRAFVRKLVAEILEDELPAAVEYLVAEYLARRIGRTARGES